MGCLDPNQYDEVGAGEVCSIETAKRLGVFQASQAPDSALCDVAGDVARPSCLLQHGVGQVRRFGQPDKCWMYACPPGFKAKGTTCEKPLKDAIVAKRARCDERWSDWFMVPNYHLGNAHKMIGGTCYAPCGPDRVPDAQGTHCVGKDEHDFGKYAETSDFCPLAWITRLGLTPSRAEAKILKDVTKLREDERGEPTTHLGALEDSARDAGRALATAAHSGLDGVEEATRGSDAGRACGALGTPERLAEAYATCARVRDDPEGVVREFQEELDDDEQRALAKSALLKQACSAVFCGGTTDGASALGREPICFKDERVKLAEAKVASGAGDVPEVSARVSGALRIMIALLIVPTVCVVLALLVWFVFSRIRDWWMGWRTTSSAAEEALAITVPRRQ